MPKNTRISGHDLTNHPSMNPEIQNTNLLNQNLNLNLNTRENVYEKPYYVSKMQNNIQINALQQVPLHPKQDRCKSIDEINKCIANKENLNLEFSKSKIIEEN